MTSRSGPSQPDWSVDGSTSSRPVGAKCPAHWWGPFAVWDGGLGIWGGIALGTLVGPLAPAPGRRRGRPLHGRRRARPARRPGDRPGRQLLQPGALRRAHQPALGARRSHPPTVPSGYEAYATFQPTFLYELIWNLGLAAFLVWLGHHRRIRPPGLFALYVTGYSAFRIFEESLRVDPAHHILGLRLNFFVACALTITGAIWFLASQGEPGRRPGSGAAGRRPCLRSAGQRSPWPVARRGSNRSSAEVLSRHTIRALNSARESNRAPKPDHPATPTENLGRGSCASPCASQTGLMQEKTGGAGRASAAPRPDRWRC